MARPLSTPMPALVALRLLPAGELTALALLGMAVIESDGGPTHDLRIADAYADLATDGDPAAMVRDYYADQGEKHPWAKDSIGALTEHLVRPAPPLVKRLRIAAEWLSQMSTSGMEHAANADLLGTVLLELNHLAHRRKGLPGGYSPLALTTLEAAMAAAEGKAVTEGSRFADMWAGTGMRVVGHATLLRAMGQDPQKIRWLLFEGDKVARACLALNCIAFELGDQVEIRDGSAYRTEFLAAVARGEAPSHWLEVIPAEHMDGSRVEEGWCTCSRAKDKHLLNAECVARLVQARG